MEQSKEAPQNPFEAAAEEAEKYLDAHDQSFRQGGKIAAEEYIKKVRAGEPEPADQVKEPVEGTTPKEEAKTEPTSEEESWPSKYKTKEEADKAYFHLVQNWRKDQQERDELKRQVEAFKGLVQERQQPTERAEKRNALKALEDYGVPSDMLGEAIQEVASQTVTNFLTPLITQAQALQHMQEKYGDEYTKHKQELDLFVESDPEVKALVSAARAQGQGALAEEFGYLRFVQDRNGRVEVAMKANQETSQKLKEEAKKDAAIVGSKRTSEPKSQQSKAPNIDKIRELASMGYEREAYGELIGKQLPDKDLMGHNLWE